VADPVKDANHSRSISMRFQRKPLLQRKLLKKYFEGNLLAVPAKPKVK
jgi:hypothetical protein